MGYLVPLSAEMVLVIDLALSITNLEAQVAYSKELNLNSKSTKL